MAALAATIMAAAMAEARAMAAVKVMRTSHNDDDDATMRRCDDATTRRRDDATTRRRDDATTQRRNDAGDANNNADREGRGRRTTRLPGGDEGSYYPHHRMGGAAHGFVRPPPRLAAKPTTTAASARGPAGSPPRLHAHQQARATTCDDNDEIEDDRIQRATKAPAAVDTRVTRCAGSWRLVTQSLTIAGRRATTKRAADKHKQQPTIAC